MNKVLGIAILSSSLLFSSIIAFAEDTITQTSTSTTTTSTNVTTTSTDTTQTSTPSGTTGTTGTSTGTIASATPTPKDADFATALSNAYSNTVTAQDVANARATGLGYGEIGNLYGLSAISGTSVSDIAAMRQTQGWGEIAQALGVKLSDIKAVDNPDKQKTKVDKDTPSEKASKDKPTAAKANNNSSASSKGSSSSNSNGSHGGSSSGHGGSGGGNGGSGGGGHGGGHK